MVTRRLALADQEEAVLLFGQHDRNLKEIERRFNAAGSRFGEAHNVDGAMARRILEACL